MTEKELNTLKEEAKRDILSLTEKEAQEVLKILQAERKKRRCKRYCYSRMKN